VRDRLIDSVRVRGSRACALLLPIFVLAEVNYPRLSPQSQLAVFATLGLMLLFLATRDAEAPSGWKEGAAALVAAGLTLAVGAYLVVQTEPIFERWWIDGRPLGERAGIEATLDIAVGVVGLVLVLVAAWRSVGAALPILAGAFLVYGYVGDLLPNWLLPHRGYDIERLVGQTFLHSQGVFGVALKVMFTYVFLFVVFGALLEATGATEFIIEASRRRFRASPGGPAKVAVISSGLMGSLSGSAVANTASTGTFTIPMMKSAGFAPRVAAGLEAAASSGGALVPPVMGAGAYMMLEIIDPPVTYLQIIRAALIPALLYYLSLYLFVHFHGRRIHARSRPATDGVSLQIVPWQGVVFAGGLGVLVVLLVSGYTVFRSVSVAMVVVVLLGLGHERTRLSLGKIVSALKSSSANGVSLIAAASCVGIIIGVVTLTGVGTRLPGLILPLAQGHLTLALLAIMISSIVLGMGLPSAVCYLLMATLIGPVLGNLGVVPLAAHLFIFYFGMMSMVTPPVALAGYAASSIAGSRLIETSISAFRFALVGFVLPYLFVYKPELLMLNADGTAAQLDAIVAATSLTACGVLALSAALAGYVRRPLELWARSGFLLAAILLLFPGTREVVWRLSVTHLLGLALLTALWIDHVRRSGRLSARFGLPKE
jgi:TRAP transporter 4TM/12TM fusion protein